MELGHETVQHLGKQGTQLDILKEILASLQAGPESDESDALDLQQKYLYGVQHG